MLKVETIFTQPENEKILVVSWFDYDPFMKLHFERYFFNIIELINRSDIKKLVLDCSCRRHNPTPADFKEIFELFLSGLSTTKLEKLARICPPDLVFSSKYNQLLKQMVYELDLTFELRSFKNTKEAFNWINEENVLPAKTHAGKQF
jgi:hypothetical protein